MKCNRCEEEATTMVENEPKCDLHAHTFKIEKALREDAKRLDLTEEDILSMAEGMVDWKTS